MKVKVKETHYGGRFVLPWHTAAHSASFCRNSTWPAPVSRPAVFWDCAGSSEQRVTDNLSPGSQRQIPFQKCWEACTTMPIILPQISNLSQEMSMPCLPFFLTIVTPLGRELTKSLTPRWSGSERTWRWHESSVARWPPGQPRQSESLGCKPSDAKQNAARCGMWTETSLESMALEGGHEIRVSFVNSSV